LLKNALFTSRTTIKEQNDTTWDSVYWNDESYRPDKTSKTLNDLHNKLDRESQKKLIDTYQNVNKTENGGETDFLTLFLGKSKFNVEFSRHGPTTKEGIEKFYQESKDYVQWEGDEFVHKPLALSKINLSQLRDRQSFQDVKLIVRYSTAILSTPINFVQNIDLTVTDEWQNLKEELKGNYAHLRRKNAN
jgi:hypothetical protein